MTRSEALRRLQDDAKSMAWHGQDMTKVLVAYGRAVVELAGLVQPEIVITRWEDDHYMPSPPRTPGHNRAIFWGEKPWQ